MVSGACGELCRTIEPRTMLYFSTMTGDHMENFLDDRSYYFTLHEDARLLKRSAEIKCDAQIVTILDIFLQRVRAIGDVTLAYWRYGQSGNRTDIAWAMGFEENDDPLDTLDTFLAEFGFTDHNLHHKSLSELVHMDPVIGTLAKHIETSRENYVKFLESARIVEDKKSY